MKKSLIITIVCAVLVAFLFAGGCSGYNGMVRSQQAVDKQWGNVENAYQRRADLIPNLVNTVKGYAEHESQVLETVTAARAGYDNAFEAVKALPADSANINSRAYRRAQDQLSQAGRLYINAVHEAYPDLKANENFLDLQAQLEQTENRVATERKRYNEEVEKYNVKVMSFPNNLLASMFGFNSREMFRAEEGAQSAPKVQF